MMMYYLDACQINGTLIQRRLYFITQNTIDLKWFHNKVFKIHKAGYLAEAPDSSGHGSEALVDVAKGPSCARALDFHYGGEPKSFSVVLYSFVDAVTWHHQSLSALINSSKAFSGPLSNLD